MELLKIINQYIFKIISLPNIFFIKKNFKKIIFLHVPHCGGNTIHRFLKYNLGFRGKKIVNGQDNNVSEIFKDGNDNIYNFGHFGIDFIKKNFNEKDYFYILNVRNPKNIYLSKYYRNKKFYYRDKKLRDIHNPESTYPTLEEFLITNKSINRDNIICRYLSGLFIYKPNKTKITEQIYDSAVTNLDLFNFIFILEHSKVGLKKLPKKLQILINYASIFRNNPNKYSDSKYPPISKEANELLDSMTYYDNKLYKIILDKEKF